MKAPNWFPFRIVRVAKANARPQVNPNLDCRCQICQEDTRCEFYMVHNHLWEQATLGLPPTGPMVMRGGIIYGGSYLCVPCIEGGLGRRLTAGDFSTAPCNSEDYARTDRLLARMAA